MERPPVWPHQSATNAEFVTVVCGLQVFRFPIQEAAQIVEPSIGISLPIAGERKELNRLRSLPNPEHRHHHGGLAAE